MRLIAVCLFYFYPLVIFTQQTSILPHPVVFKSIPGSIQIDGELSLDFTKISDELLQQLKTTSQFYHQVAITDRKKNPLIIFKKIQNVPLDSYSINVNGQIIITYSSAKACYFAFHSLMQLIQEEGGVLHINHCFVDDYPKYQWRGMHLDVSRHFFSTQEIKQFLDIMAMYKFTTFHWH